MLRPAPLRALPLVLVAACSATPEATSPPAPTAGAEAAPPPPVEAMPAKVAPDSDGPDGVRRWASWEGPKTGAAITTKRAWVIAPSMAAAGSDKLSFATVDLRVVDVEKADGDEVVFEERGHRYAVPAALAWPTQPPRGLAKGAPVRCAFAGGSAVARVDAADARSVTCAFRFMEKTRRERTPPAEVRVLSGRLETGAPALVRFGSDAGNRYRGWIVATSGEDVWVELDTQFPEGDGRAGSAVHRVRASGVEVIDVSKPLKVGDGCLATDITSVVPCKVSKVIEGGLAYVVDFAGGAAGSHKEWTFDEVAPAAKK